MAAALARMYSSIRLATVILGGEECERGEGYSRVFSGVAFHA